MTKQTNQVEQVSQESYIEELLEAYESQLEQIRFLASERERLEETARLAQRAIDKTVLGKAIKRANDAKKQHKDLYSELRGLLEDIGHAGGNPGELQSDATFYERTSAYSWDAKELIEYAVESKRTELLQLTPEALAKLQEKFTDEEIREMFSVNADAAQSAARSRDDDVTLKGKVESLEEVKKVTAKVSKDIKP